MQVYRSTHKTGQQDKAQDRNILPCLFVASETLGAQFLPHYRLYHPLTLAGSPDSVHTVGVLSPTAAWGLLLTPAPLPLTLLLRAE